MKIAFVVQRYGLEVNGGAELEARQIAEAVSPYVQVEVLTNSATDYLTWNNVNAPGDQKQNGEHEAASNELVAGAVEDQAEAVLHVGVGNPGVVFQAHVIAHDADFG